MVAYDIRWDSKDADLPKSVLISDSLAETYREDGGNTICHALEEMYDADIKSLGIDEYADFVLPQRERPTQIKDIKKIECGSGSEDRIYTPERDENGNWRFIAETFMDGEPVSCFEIDADGFDNLIADLNYYYNKALEGDGYFKASFKGGERELADERIVLPYAVFNPDEEWERIKKKSEKEEEERLFRVRRRARDERPDEPIRISPIDDLLESIKSPYTKSKQFELDETTQTLKRQYPDGSVSIIPLTPEEFEKVNRELEIKKDTEKRQQRRLDIEY